MSTIGVDKNGDLALGVEIATGAKGVAQNVLQRLNVFRGTWFLDVILGVDYYNDVLDIYSDHRNAAIRAEILKVDGVLDAEVESEFEYERNEDGIRVSTRTLRVTPIVYYEGGEMEIGPVLIEPTETNR